ncbi:tetratricopeptide repeat protein [Psychrobacillus sp. NPDC093180]|uniref:tetratricopeptide repeat protein n=1 Tax=Psychrobacillus sp. NPDC093180 TaxID=3364489 RepID=UPI0037F7751F
MREYVELYNEAIIYLQNENFEKADEILTNLYSKFPNNQNIIWNYGLTQVTLGNPHKAIDIWRNLHLEKETNHYSFVKLVSEKLPKYEEIYEEYNLAVSHIQNDNTDEAFNIFQNLINYQDSFPLPKNIYIGYLLLLIRGGKDILVEINRLPIHIKEMNLIKEIIKQWKQQRFRNLSSSKGKKSRKYLYGIGLVASALLGAFIIQQTEVEKNEESIVTAKKSELILSNKYEEQVEENKIVLETLLQENEALSKQLSEKELKVEDLNRLQSTLEASNISISDLESQAGLSTYKKGLQFFKDKKYKEATNSLKLSLEYRPNEYFSDDAYYYLIQSTSRLNSDFELRDLYDQFLLNKGENFISSPFYDDVLLGKAELLIKNGQHEEGIALFEQIMKDFSTEWTAQRAQKFLNDLEEVQ